MGKNSLQKFKNARRKSVFEVVKEEINIESVPTDETFIEIEVDKIASSPDQTREIIDTSAADIIDLARNIEINGLLQPIIVKPYNDPEGQYSWCLVAGERRLAAHKYLGRKLIRAYVRDDLANDKVRSWSATVSENVCRKQLTSREAFEAIEKAKKGLGLGVNEIAEDLRVSPKRVRQIQGISNLPKDLVNILTENEKLTKRHIDAFKLLVGRDKIDSIEIKEEDPDFVQEIKSQIHELLDEVIKGDISGEEALKLAKSIKNPAKTNSFLYTLNKRLAEAVKRRPSKMSDKKRIIVINQAKNMVNILLSLIDEQEKLLKKEK